MTDVDDVYVLVGQKDRYNSPSLQTCLCAAGATAGGAVGPVRVSSLVRDVPTVSPHGRGTVLTKKIWPMLFANKTVLELFLPHRCLHQPLLAPL